MILLISCPLCAPILPTSSEGLVPYIRLLYHDSELMGDRLLTLHNRPAPRFYTIEVLGKLIRPRAPMIP
jgi:hypothetical protein